MEFCRLGFAAAEGMAGAHTAQPDFRIHLLARPIRSEGSIHARINLRPL